MANTYESVAPMASVTTPNYTYTASDAPQYQGLMGGDYDKLQEALVTPAQIAAKTAYEQGYNKLGNAMGGRGLYGSSVMAQQANQGLDTTYQNTMASAAAQAAAQRYNLQAQGLQNQNAFNKDLYGLGLTRESALNNFNQNTAQLNMTQNSNLWKAAESEAARKMGFYQNQDSMAQQLSLAQQGINNQQQAYQNSQNAGYLGAAGTALGGLLSSGGQSALGSLYNTVSGWLGGGGDDYTYGDLGSESAWNDYWSDYE